jgi:hypothetical protein
MSRRPKVADRLAAKADYAQYLASPEWRKRRDEAIQRAEGRCQLCNSAQRLQVHHRTYERRGNERPMDLTVLCEGCHQHFHGIVGGAKRNLSAVPSSARKRPPTPDELAREFGPLRDIISTLIGQRRLVTIKQIRTQASERSRTEIKSTLARMVREGTIYEPQRGYWGFRLPPVEHRPRNPKAMRTLIAAEDSKKKNLHGKDPS